MGWLDRVNAKKEDEKLPERLRGKTPEQVAKELEAADQLAKDLEAEKAARLADSEKVTQIQTEFDKVKGDLARAEANRNVPPKKTDEELANFIEEPDKAFQQRVEPLTAVTLNNASMTSRIIAQQQLDNMDLQSNGKTMDGRLFRAWGNEIDGEAKKYNVGMLTTPQAWLGIFYYLKGVHADELRDPETRKKKYNFLEPSTTPVNTHKEEDKKPSDQLTDAEKHVADKMGVSHENYLKRKKAMQFINA
jgi:hypothetical protein